MPASRGPVLLLALVALVSSSLGAPRPEALGAPGLAVSAAASAQVDAARRALETLPTGLLPAEVRAVAEVLVRESQRFGLAPELVLAVVQVESSGHAFAVSSVGALGLMQLLPSTAAALAPELGVTWKGPQTLFDPVANVRLGIGYLARLLERYGSVATALTAYNWGPTRIARILESGDPLPASYAQRVLAVSQTDGELSI